MKKITRRKKPLQIRSRQMVDDIIKASIRILKRGGGKSFTTIKVAEAAGISVGSLYQYFPNKESILYQLQENEWFETWELMDKILSDKSLPPIERHHLFIREFFRTEYEEADLRRALVGTGANFEKTKAFKEIEFNCSKSLKTFIFELTKTKKDLDFRVDFYITLIAEIAEEISSRAENEEELIRWSNEISKMLLINLQVEPIKV